MYNDMFFLTGEISILYSCMQMIPLHNYNFIYVINICVMVHISIFALQQVLEFFSNMIRLFGDNIQIVVKPTLHDGMNVGVHWKFGN